jgi:K+-sensing histidine kinase KdpD
MEHVNKLLVCVTPQRNSFRLIKKGSGFAKDFDAELFVIYVQRNLDLKTDKKTAELINELFTLTSEEAGEMHIEVSKDIPGAIAEFINKNNITHVLLGESMVTKIDKLLKKDILSRVISKAEHVQFLILERTGKTSGYTMPVNLKDQRQRI